MGGAHPVGIIVAELGEDPVATEKDPPEVMKSSRAITELIFYQILRFSLT